MKQIWNFILENWDVIAPIVYEIIVRVIPTKKNLSLIDNGWKILNLIVTNRRKPHGNETIANSSGKTKNIVNVRIDKHILSVLLVLISFVSVAQINQTGKAYFSYNANDSVFIKNTRQSYQTNTGNTGVLWFDEWQNKWRIWDGSQYVDLIQNSASGLVAASNGLWDDGGTVKLGINPISENTDLLIDPGIDLTYDIGTDGVGGFGRFFITTGISGEQWFDIDPSNNFYSINAEGLSLNIDSDVETFITSPTIDINGANDLDLRGAAGITSNNKHFFTPTATTAPINLGLQAADPSGIVNGDMWINSTTFNSLKVRMNNTTEFLLRNSAPGNTGEILWFNSGNVGRTASNPAFTFTTATNTLTIPRVVTSTTATLPAFNLGSFAGTPSTVVDNDAWYNSSTSNISYRQSGTTRAFMMAPLTQIINAIPFSPGNSGAVHAYESNFTWNPSTDELTAGSIIIDNNTIFGTTSNLLLDAVGFEITSVAKHNFTADANNAGVNIGTFAGDPTPLSNGDLWVNTSTQNLRARVNGQSFSIQPTESGTYTPTGVAVNNVDGVTTYLAQYMRVGNTVTVSGRVDYDPTGAGTSTRWTMTCPVTTNFSGALSAGGTFIQADTGGNVGAIQSVISSNTVQFSTQALSGTAVTGIFYSYTYRVE
jgi:hypothetical protein